MLVLLGYKTGKKSDGIERKPGESQCSVVLAGASGYIWLACLVWVAPQPLLGLQERVLLWTTSHEKEGPSLGVAEIESGLGTSFWAAGLRNQSFRSLRCKFSEVMRVLVLGLQVKD